MMWMNQKKGKAGLENRRDIPRAHIGFYTQCGKGLENQRCRHRMGNQRHAQAFTLSAAQGWRTSKRSQEHTQAFTLNAAKGWRTRDTVMHRLLHSEQRRAGEPEKIPRAHTGFYTQCGKGLENQRHMTRTGFYTQSGTGLGNQRDIPSAHTGFYAQCSTGKMEPMEFVHINLYTVMKSTRP